MNLFLIHFSSSSSSPDSEAPSFHDEASLRNVHVSALGTVETSSSSLEVSDVDLGTEASSMVPLEPFVHQVGGHFPMVCLATETM